MKRRLFIPEVIQTSGMDCGPAALKAIFGGFGRYLSYGRLREACQTDVDGTSIDALEELAPRLGLAATQSMLPVDFVLREEFRALPAIAVIRLADGAPHFVVLWRVHGAFVQVMDPGEGRVWMHRDRLLESLYVHEQEVPRAAWEEWAASAEFRAAMGARMQALGVDAQLWADLAQQDAALRLAETLLRAKQLARGAAAAQLLALCATHPAEIPDEFRMVSAVAGDPEQLRLRGAVMLSISGAFAEPADAALPETLAAVLNEPPPRVWGASDRCAARHRCIAARRTGGGVAGQRAGSRARCAAAAGPDRPAWPSRTRAATLRRDAGAAGFPRRIAGSGMVVAAWPAVLGHTARGKPARTAAAPDSATRRSLLPVAPGLGHGDACALAAIAA
ncbi:MAG: cysteine peptidase family C39 domain-containing protein [Pseudomonadota bacterium]